MERDFKGVWIPKEIYLAEGLCWTEKILLVEINSLENEKGCFASNEHFAKFLGVSKDRVSKMISGLVKKGYVTVRLEYRNGTKQIEKRWICTTIRYRLGDLEPIGKNTYRGIGKNTEDNNTLFNNTINNTNNNICSPNIISKQIEEIWLLYPNKKGKAAAIKKLPKLIKEYGYEKIKKCVERYALECKGKDKQYVKHGSTFFNGGYMDYLDENIEAANKTEKSVFFEEY